MPVTINDKLVVAIPSRALFDLDESHAVFEKQGLDAYEKYQIDKENDKLLPGFAYPLVKKLLAIKHPESNERLVEVILLSRNSADTGLRIFNSIQHHELDITRAAFTKGASPYLYVKPFSAHLFLSAHADDVAKALQAGVAAATIVQGINQANNNTQLRIAFDGDSVLFSDESEKIFQRDGLEAFAENESKLAANPLDAGPFKGFLQKLQTLQRLFPNNACPIRTALVTARSAPAHERVIRTLRAWDIRIDEALFLGGLSKAEFLKAFAADFFFDDQTGHCTAASQHVATGHVPSGVMNE